MNRPVPDALRAARRSLDEVDGAAAIGDWWWHEGTGRWALSVSLRSGAEPSRFVPTESDWFVVADRSYPRGRVTFYPAQQGGLDVTFPHQHYNAVAANAPWRCGDICLEDFLAGLGRAGLGAEPESADTRLRWRAERAMEWLRAAAQDRLLPAGTPFELPDFPETGATPLVAFRESSDSFALWRSSHAWWGTAEVFRPPDVPSAVVVQRFLDPDDRDLVAAERSVWVRLLKVPALRPWQAPSTWGELRDVAARQGFDLDKGLRRAARRIQDGRAHVALVGFPIPRTVGVPDVQMHWQALRLPAPSQDRQSPYLRQSGEAGLRRNGGRTVFASDQRIDWLPSENWHRTEIATRGRFPDAVAAQHVVVIGAGALGSAIAELLVRAGVSRLTLIDEDVLQAGNLVRHTLGLADLLRPKASAVAEHLNLSNPSARVDALVERFPPSDSDQPHLRAADAIVDTTGEDGVAASMAEFPWGRPRLFASVSLGLGARRIYLYTARATTFPNTHFRRLVDPLAAEDHERFEGEPPWEAIGCWHPVFPARADDIWLLAAAAVKRIVGATEQGSPEAKLEIIEQEADGGVSVVRIY